MTHELTFLGWRGLTEGIVIVGVHELPQLLNCCAAGLHYEVNWLGIVARLIYQWFRHGKGPKPGKEAFLNCIRARMNYLGQFHAITFKGDVGQGRQMCSIHIEMLDMMLAVCVIPGVSKQTIAELWQIFRDRCAMQCLDSSQFWSNLSDQVTSWKEQIESARGAMMLMSLRNASC